MRYLHYVSSPEFKGVIHKFIFSIPPEEISPLSLLKEISLLSFSTLYDKVPVPRLKILKLEHEVSPKGLPA